MGSIATGYYERHPYYIDYGNRQLIASKRDTYDPETDYDSSSESEDDDGSEYQPSDYQPSEHEQDATAPGEASQCDSDSEKPEHEHALDDPIDYVFERGDLVWINAQGIWYHGKVMTTCHSKKRPGVTLYMVFFRGNLRMNLVPMDGTIKPDTPHYRRLLEEANLI